MLTKRHLIMLHMSMREALRSGAALIVHQFPALQMTCVWL